VKVVSEFILKKTFHVNHLRGVDWMDNC